jgi:hypothetical protein
MNLNQQSHKTSSIYSGPHTGGCPIECVPDLIRKRAYQFFEERGFEPGHELDDWLRAELEIKHHLNV